jgi:hypothetical protein
MESGNPLKIKYQKHYTLNEMNYFQRVLTDKYRKYKWKNEVLHFDMYRKSYSSFNFNDKIKMAHKWLMRYPEQAHYTYDPINYWLENIVENPASVLEIGGWRGDLAEEALSSFKNIKLWHNYDLLKLGNFQKCNDSRYKLISLDDYLWNQSLNYEYNSLIATHMIEHICWSELFKLIRWIPAGISTVLFEAPLPASDNNINWKGDHSSHVLEKGWEQIVVEMKNQMFSVDYTEGNTFIFRRHH